MTALELESTLLSLGCNEFADEEFNYLANAALRKIYNDLPVKAKGSIHAHGILPTTTRTGVFHQGGKDASYPLIGRAFCVRVCGGTPRIVVSTGAVSTTHIFPNGVSVLKGFIVNNMGVIAFTGDYDYTVEYICHYDKIYSNDERDIPDGTDKTTYDLSRFYSDFMYLTSPLTDREGNVIEGVSSKGKEIFTNADYVGDIFFEYRKGPGKDVEIQSYTDIDIPKEYEMLLPVAFMSLYFADTDEDKAKLYLEKYEFLLKNAYHAAEKEITPTVAPGYTQDYKITDGWA